MKSVQRLLFFSLITPVLISCSAPSFGSGNLIENLKNTGPAALSSENPYISTNLLLAKEMQSNSEVDGFIKHRGTPSALEVEKSMFSPYTLKLYYPADREMYLLEREENVWIINGPEHIPQESLLEINKLGRTLRGDPALESASTETTGKIEAKDLEQQGKKGQDEGTSAKTEDPFIAKLNAAGLEKSEGASFKSPAIPETPKELKLDTPAPASSPTATKELLAPVPKLPTPESTPAAAVAEPLMPKLGSSHGTKAELTPRGDLVHYVTYPNETLQLISKWYTGNPEDASKIARINAMAKPDALKPGDMIVIPRYLVKNEIRMTEEDLGKLRESK